MKHSILLLILGLLLGLLISSCYYNVMLRELRDQLQNAKVSCPKDEGKTIQEFLIGE